MMSFEKRSLPSASSEDDESLALFHQQSRSRFLQQLLPTNRLVTFLTLQNIFLQNPKDAVHIRQNNSRLFIIIMFSLYLCKYCYNINKSCAIEFDGFSQKYSKSSAKNSYFNLLQSVNIYPNIPYKPDLAAHPN